MSLDKLKQKRIAQRGQFTRTLHKLESLLEDASSETMNEIETTLELLSERDKDLRLSDESILSTMQDIGVTQEEYEKEFIEIEDYHEKFTVIKVAVRQKEKQSRSPPDSGVADRDFAFQNPVLPPAPPRIPRVERRLPEFEIIKYDGDPRKWITFYSQFQRIHQDATLDREYKLQLLLNSMKQGSKPFDIISSFPVSAENYEPAFDYLKERFGQESVLIQVYIRDLLQLIIANKTSPLDLSTLYDKLQTQLRALDSLGVTQDNYQHFLYPIVESALPLNILRAWERDRSKMIEPGTLFPLNQR